VNVHSTALRPTVALALGALLTLAGVAGVLPRSAAAEPEPDRGITVVDGAYQPSNVTVTVGTRLVWTNNGPSVHTVTAVGNRFDSGVMEVGDVFTFLFTEPGEYTYRCLIHPSKRGVVTVVPE
jgi:plastocyanin